jgi:hypothetical protein
MQLPLLEWVQVSVLFCNWACQTHTALTQKLATAASEWMQFASPWIIDGVSRIQTSGACALHLPHLFSSPQPKRHVKWISFHALLRILALCASSLSGLQLSLNFRLINAQLSLPRICFAIRYCSTTAFRIECIGMLSKVLNLMEWKVSNKI